MAHNCMHALPIIHGLLLYMTFYPRRLCIVCMDLFHAFHDDIDVQYISIYTGIWHTHPTLPIGKEQSPRVLVGG